MNDRNEKIAYYENLVIGNNAVKIETEVQEVKAKVKIKKKRNIYKAQPKNSLTHTRINRVCTIAIAFVIIATLGICVIFLKNQYSMNQMNIAIEETREKYNDLVIVNDQLEQEIIDSIDLDYIYDEATNRLEMRLPGPSEVYYVDRVPSSYTTKYKKVEIVEEEVTIANVLAYIARGW